MNDLATTSRSSRWWALVMVAAAQLLVVLDGTIVNIALPSADAELGLSADTRHWVITAYLLTFGGLLLLGGRISGAIGHRRAFVIGLLGFAAASLIGGLAWDPAVLIGARALQGVFAALLAPAALSVLTLSFVDPRERGRAFGVYAAVGATGSAIGLVVGSLLTELVSWRWCLYVMVPIAVLAALGAVLIPKMRAVSRTGRMDVLGPILSTIGIAAIVIGISMIEAQGGFTPLVLGLVAFGILMLVCFIFVERTAPNPVLPLSVLTERARAASFLAITLMFLAMFGFYLFMSYYTQTELSYSPIQAGAVLLIHAVAALIGSMLIAGRLLGRVPPATLIVAGLLAAAGGLFILTWLRADSPDIFVMYLLPAMILTGLGMGLVITPTASTSTQGLSGHEVGAAAATFNAAQQIGAAIGVAMLSTVSVLAGNAFADEHSANRVESVVHGYATALTVGTALLVIAAISTAIMMRRYSAKPQTADRVGSGG